MPKLIEFWQTKQTWPRRLVWPRTQAFQAWYTGSNPVGATIILYFDMTMHRFFEFLPGTLSWLTLILMVLLSWLSPVFIAVFIILFDIYWLMKTIYLSLHLRSTFSIMKKNLKVNWLEELKNDTNNPNNIRMPRIVEKD